MKSQWSDDGARRAVDQWAAEHGESVAMRLYTARLLGSDPKLVLHGGGNVSVKQPLRNVFGQEVEALLVKSSGSVLATLTPHDLPALELAPLDRLCSLDTLSDDAMANEIRRCMFDLGGPAPSVETLVHAVCPHRYVDHTHADAVVTVANQPDSDPLRAALGNRVVFLPYVRAGLELAQAVKQALRSCGDIEGILLAHHGLITFGDDARSSYETHLRIVSICEDILRQRKSKRNWSIAVHAVESVDITATRIAPILRGLLATPTGDDDRPYDRLVMQWRGSDSILEFVNGAHAAELVASGPLVGDHIVHTKPRALLVSDPVGSSRDEIAGWLSKAIEEYRCDYQRYVRANGCDEQSLDSGPRVVLIRGAGMFCWGSNRDQAQKIADIAEHTIQAKRAAFEADLHVPFPEQHWFDMEFRAEQRAKIRAKSDQVLSGQVVAISGGAGAIGSAIADVCLQAGAHVFLLDLDAARLEEAVDRLEHRHGSGSAAGCVVDVTDESSVQAGFDKLVLTFGGVDVVVPNAGIAYVSPIAEMQVDAFRRVMEVNATGYLLFMREGVRLMKLQGLGGHVVLNASKNVFGPGKDFGAYSASKAAGHQLGKVAAIELAGDNIRVNMINADAIFGDEDTPSGLWATVGPSRARSRNIKEEALPEFYRQRNLLQARVHGYHVGNAVVFFASNATPTTGATLPVDGGVVDAFPR